MLKRSLIETLAGKITQLWGDRAGVTALEYGIIASAMALTLVLIFKNLAATLAPIFSTVETSM